MGGGADAGLHLDVFADIAFVGDPPLTGVDPYAHAQLQLLRPAAARERSRGAGGCFHHRRSRLEDHQEGVALGVDLGPSAGGEGVAQDAAVIFQGGVVVASEALQEPPGTLDVGEQERDGFRSAVRPSRFSRSLAATMLGHASMTAPPCPRSGVNDAQRGQK
jgi:hypothetical protein